MNRINFNRNIFLEKEELVNFQKFLMGTPMFKALLTATASSPKFDEIYLSNFATLNVLDLIRRIPGVGRVSNIGRASIRIKIRK